MEGSKINSILTIEYMCNEKENQFFDRKSAKKDIKELANHIAGFANASGGTLVIGISDDGKLEGFEECPEKYNKFLKITSGDYLKTMPKFENETINIINYKGNKDKILLIHISPSINTLIRNVKDEVYLRQGDSTNKLSSEQVKIIELEAQVHLVDLLNNYIKDPQNKYNLVPAAMLVSSSGENTSNPIMAYNEALLERSKILQSTKGNNPLIEQINKQVDQLRESVFLSIENIKKSLNLTINDLKGKEKLIFDKMGTVPTLERNYVDLKRQQEINQALYLILLQKKEDYILAAGDSKDKARIIEQPYVKQKAVAPRKLYALIGMFIFTLVIPAIYLFCREQLSSLLNEYKNVKSNGLKL